MCYKKIFDYIVIIGILSFIVLTTTLFSSIKADDYVDPNIFGGGVSNSSSSSSSTSSTSTSSGNSEEDTIINILLSSSSSSTSSSSSSGSMSNGFCKTKPGSETYCTDCGPCDEGQGLCFNNSQCKSGLICSDYTCVRSSNQSSGSDGCRLQEGTLTYCAVCGPCSEGQSVCHENSECASGLVCTNNGFCVRPSNPSSSSSSGGGAGCRLPEGVESYCDPLVCGPCSEGQSRCRKKDDCIGDLVCSDNGYCVRPSSSGTCKSKPGSERYCTDCGPCEEGQGMCFNNSQCAKDLLCSNNTCIKIKREPSDGCRLTPPLVTYCGACGPCKEGEGWCDGDKDCAIGLICNNDFCVRPSIPPSGFSINNNCKVPVGSATYCTDCGPCREGQGKCSKDTDCIKGLVCSNRTGLCKKP